MANSFDADLLALAEAYEKIAESFRRQGDDEKASKYWERARSARKRNKRRETKK